MDTINCLARQSALFSASILAAIAATSLLTPSAVGAAGTAAADTAASDTLAEVIVTATRREQNLNDVPFSATALSGEPLLTLGGAADDIKQLAFKVPSLNIESSNGRAFPRFYIRGYGNSDFHDFASQPVGLVYDDIVQENPALKGFPVFDQADVEVLRGPQGTLFGRNSPAGVVKLESAKPVIGETSGFASISDGTYNSAVVQGVANLPVTDQSAFRLSIQGQHRDDWVKDPVNGAKYGGFNDWAARAQFLIKPSDAFTALLNVHGRDLTGSSTLFRANIIQPGSNALIPGFDPARIYTDGPNSASLRTVGANLHLTWSLPDVTLQSISGYESILHYFAIGDITGGCGEFTGFGGPTNPQCFAVFPSGSGPGFIPFAVETSAGIPKHSTQLTQEFRAVSAAEGPLKWQAGMYLFYEDVTANDDDYCAAGECVSTAPLFALQDITATRQKNDAEAIFGSLDYKFTDAFTATAGVRYTEDHRTMTSGFTQLIPGFSNATTAPFYAGKSASNVSGDVSATYKLDPDVNVYARIATGFRAPTLGEPGAGIGIQTTRSETTISYETGIKADLFEHKARLHFDGYYYDVSNQQLSAVGGATNVTQLINAAHTIGYGSELEFEAHPVPNLTFNVSGSLNITRIEDPNLVVAVGGGIPSPLTDTLNPTFQKPGPFGPVTYAYIDGNPLPQAAKWVGDVSLRYDFPLTASGKLYVYTDLSYRSGINFFLYESKEFDGPSLVQAGLKLGYTWADGKYDAAVFCRNCTNQIRPIGGIDFADLLGYINDPRIIGAQIRAKF